MRIRSALVACLVLAAAVPGCATPTGATAKAGLAVAQEAAQGWASDAVLATVSAMEATNLTEFRDDQNAAHADEEGTQGNHTHLEELEGMGANDGTPGDGRAPRWVYRFDSASRDASYLVITEGGDIVATVSSSLRWTSGAIRGESWMVDSDDAATRARSNATIAALQGRHDVLALTALQQFDALYPNPLWFLAYKSFMTGEHHAIAVDATNGTVLEGADVMALLAAWVQAQLMGLMPAELGTSQGSVNVAMPSDTGSFVLELPHNVLAVALTTRSGTVPMQDLQVVVTTPDGVQLWLNHTVQAPFDDVTAATATDLPPGEYSYTIELQNGALPSTTASWDFSWCTDGMLMPIGMFNGAPAACDYVDTP